MLVHQIIRLFSSQGGYLKNSIFNNTLSDTYNFLFPYPWSCVAPIDMVTISRLAPEIYKPQHKISNNVVCATSKASDQPVHTRSLIRVLASRLDIL